MDALRSSLVVVVLGTALLAGCPAPGSRAAGSSARGASPSDPAPGSAALEKSDAGGAVADDVIASVGYGKRTRRDPNDLCEPVRENLDRAAKAILSERRAGRAAPNRVFDHKSAPRFMPIVDARYALTATEHALVNKNGFAVSARFPLRGYADAFHEIYQSQLPIYVSADAILHAVYKSHDLLLEDVELTLVPRLEALLAKMHEALPGAQNDYPSDTATDADVYLTVARGLLSETEIPPVLGGSPLAASLLAKAKKGGDGLAIETLFGRPRVIDFSQYAPRGHYAKDESMQRYFRASMWLSRLELNLVSRASRSSQPGLRPNPEETPREAVLALAIADLAARAQVLSEIEALDAVWAAFAGKREDVSIAALVALRKQAGITSLTAPDAADKLRAAIGSRFARTMRMHYMPQGSMPLPAIATMLGPRVVADAQAETELAHAQVPGRDKPSFADVAFMLGHERARKWLASDLKTFPELAGRLEAGRGVLARAGNADMYAAWLGAIGALATPPPGELPSFTKTDAFSDLRVNSTVAAYAQLRHNYVLIAGQAYDEGGCEVPDGYVDPALPVYEALLTYAKRGAAAMAALGSPKGEAYFSKLDAVLSVLIAISKDELAGRALSEDEKRWLSMVVEIVPPSSDGPGSNDGWYFDLFPSSADAFAEHAFVADWYTSSNANAVVYAGATNPRLGFFVVDTGGDPRILVGPVARAFEHVGRLDTRLKDTDVDKLRTLREPWAASYTAAAPAAPPLVILSTPGDDAADGRTFALKSTRALGRVTVELLDHHRMKVGSASVYVGTGWARVSVKQNDESFAEVVRVRYGEFTREVGDGFGGVNEGIGGMDAIPSEKAWDLQMKLSGLNRSNSSP